jgi:hypothetical protein
LTLPGENHRRQGTYGLRARFPEPIWYVMAGNAPARDAQCLRDPLSDAGPEAAVHVTDAEEDDDN